ncbi:MAG: SMC-Scp complex subunit ScpB [Planctomycetota bacterium]
MDKEEIRQAIEALILVSAEPISIAKITNVMEGIDRSAAREAIGEIQNRLKDGNWGFRLEGVAGGYQYLTVPANVKYIEKMLTNRKPSSLSKSAIETLAIIAYKQPVKRQDIEAIRGVSCGETIRTLIEKDLVKVVGKEDCLGKPLLYGTTASCLKAFGLMSLKDLPNPSELKQ